MLDSSLLENLDGMFPDDLRAHAAKLRATQVAPEDMDARNALAAYAETKASAMEYRAAGRIQEASKLENACDAIYDELPSYAKW